jgi:hypothetical protein
MVTFFIEPPCCNFALCQVSSETDDVRDESGADVLLGGEFY